MLGDTYERFRVEALASCLMPNHYHLLLRCPDGGISAAMQHLGHLQPAGRLSDVGG